MYDIFRDAWIDGYRVTAFPLWDKIFVHIEYIRPGGAVSRPAWEFTAYLAGEDEQNLRDYPTTIVCGLVSMFHSGHLKQTSKSIAD